MFQVIMAVLQGRIDTARHLLSFHGNKNTCIFRSMDELLRKMPNINVVFAFFMIKLAYLAYYFILLKNLNHLSTLEFKARWEYWQKECVNLFVNGDFTNEKEFEVICNVSQFIFSNLVILKYFFII